MTTATKIHVFEKARLGTAPFRVTGYAEKTYQAGPDAPIQAGATCDYCGTSIKDVFYIKGTDGEVFKVGSTCVGKTGDAGLRKVVDAKVRELKTQRRHAREAARIEAGHVLLQRADVQAALKAQAHPLDWRAAQGDTMVDWANWMLANSGNAGKLQVMRRVEKLAKELDG